MGDNCNQVRHVICIQVVFVFLWYALVAFMDRCVSGKHVLVGWRRCSRPTSKNADVVMYCRNIDDWRERWGLFSEAESYER